MSADQTPKREKVYSLGQGAIVEKGQKIKVMTYNVQFFAGRNYLFFFDVPDFSGPDFNVRPEDVKQTMEGVAKTILAEAPDVVLLQEVDDGARRTGKRDQLADLLSLLNGAYPYYTSSFYWRSAFIPHPKIMGSMGIKLSTLSKYEITEVIRHDLPSPPANFIMKPFLANRILMAAMLKYKDGGKYVVINAHLDAFVMGSDVMERQVAKVDQVLSSLDQEGTPWVIGGDFNLLPVGQYETLPDDQKSYYNSVPEIKKLYERFNIVPSLEQLKNEPEKWFTFWGNDPKLKSADRTLDYLMYSEKLKLENSYVLKQDTSELSDHFPVIAEFVLP